MIAKMEVDSHVDETIDDTQEAIERALTMCGLKMEGYAKKLCRVDTGLLRNSITFVTAGHPGTTYDDQGGGEMAKFKSKSGSVRYASRIPVQADEKNTVAVGTNVSYGQYVEYGTKHMAPRYFLRRSISDHLDLYKRIISDELKEVNK